MATWVASSSRAADKSGLVYIGTYTGAKSKGIYAAHFDASTGGLTNPELAAETTNPTFLAVHPNHRFLYAVGETDRFQGKPTGAVSAFAIEPGTEKLSLLNQQPSGGGGPCHLALDHTSKCLLVANYGSGSIASFPVQADGKLGDPGSVIQHHGSSVDHSRQEGPHAHFITTDPANRLALTCDLGLDKVLIYDLDPKSAALKPHSPAFATVPAGAGPRHLAFHPNGKWAYLVNEMAVTVTFFEYDRKQGALNAVETISALGKDFSGTKSGAEIQVHPNGNFLYASVRGHNSIAIFSVDGRTGRLTPKGHQSTEGKTPRHFIIDPSGKWLLAENQDSDSIVSLRLDEKTGALTPTGHKVEVGAPVCLVFVGH